MSNDKDKLGNSIRTALEEGASKTTNKPAQGGLHALFNKEIPLQKTTVAQKSTEEINAVLSELLNDVEGAYYGNFFRIRLPHNRQFSYTLIEGKKHTDTIKDQVRLPLIKAITYAKEMHRLQHLPLKDYDPTPPAGESITELLVANMSNLQENPRIYLEELYQRLCKELNILIELGVENIRDWPTGIQIRQLNDWLKNGGKTAV